MQQDDEDSWWGDDQDDDALGRAPEEPQRKRRRLSDAGLYFDDDGGLEDADWEGMMLPDERERAAEVNLSPSPRKHLAVLPAASVGCHGGFGTPLDDRFDDGDHPGQEGEGQDQHDGERDKEAEEEEEEEYEKQMREQEAALAARYNIAALLQGRFGQLETPKGPSHGFSAGGGFTSARGKAIAAPSDEALRRAAELTKSPPPPGVLAGKRIGDDDGGRVNTDALMIGARAAAAMAQGGEPCTAEATTPLHGRGANRFGAASSSNATGHLSLVTPLGQRGKAHSSAFKTPSLISANGKPLIQPLRLAPKGKPSLLRQVNRKADRTESDRAQDRDVAEEPPMANPKAAIQGDNDGSADTPTKLAAEGETRRMAADDSGFAEDPAFDDPDFEQDLLAEVVAANLRETINHVEGQLHRQPDTVDRTAQEGVPVHLDKSAVHDELSVPAVSESDTTQIPSHDAEDGRETVPAACEDERETVESSAIHPMPMSVSADPSSTPEAAHLTTAPSQSDRSHAPEVAGFKTPAKVLQQPFRVPKRNAGNVRASPSNPRSPFTRLSLEMNQHNTPRTATNRSTFKTPFKDGVKPTNQQLEERRRVGRDSTPALTPPSAGAATTARSIKEERLAKSTAFVLAAQGPRCNMRSYGLNPFYTADDLIEAGLPNEIMFMTFAKAASHSFVIHGHAFGADLAFEELTRYSSCKNISKDWVRNHWTLIVWKTAGVIRCKPNELGSRWSFNHVCDQLKYRYEREYNRGQRSCIRRIQERDSASTGPMTLVVTQVLYEEKEIPADPGSDEERQGIVLKQTVPVALEVSDGWYCMKTNLDEALYRAAWFRNIFSGMKIAVQGAKLDGPGDGAEPLEAYESTKLTISGNSTSRAKWDAKLGFRRPDLGPFICSFRSLLPDGGHVPVVDIIITRMYPIGFRGEFVEGESVDMWNEVEELERQTEYDIQRQRAVQTVRAQQQASTEKYIEIQSRLESALANGGRSRAKDESLEGQDFTDIYTRLEEEPDKMGPLIARLSGTLLEETLEYARKRVESLQADLLEDTRREVEVLCPSRTAKQFRVLRVVDAHAQRTCEGRDCQLTVAEPARLGEGFLKEGRRYLVSNLFPSRVTSWSSPRAISGEIFLSTRFDSRWRILQ